jgi:hypothetical protein
MTLLPEIRDEIRAAARQRAGHPVAVDGSAKPWRPSLGSLGAIAVSVIAVGVVLAVILLDAHHAPTNPPGGASGAGTNYASQRAQLLEHFAVLRRPQTSADRRSLQSPGDGGLLPGELTLPFVACQNAQSTPAFCGLRLDRQLVRTINLPRSGYRAAVIPVKSTRTSAFAQRGLDVALAFRGPGVFIAESSGVGVRQALPGVSQILAHGLFASSDVQTSHHIPSGVTLAAILVPDGVARVSLDSISLTAPRTGRRIAQIPAATATVHDNIALVRFTGLTQRQLGVTLNRREYGGQSSGHLCTITSITYEIPTTARMAWQNTQGNTTHTTTTHFYLYVHAHPAPGTRADSPGCR